MKRFLLIFTLISASLSFAVTRTEKRIARLVKPYEKVIEFVSDLDSIQQVNDHDVFVFFYKYGLYHKKDVTKFKRVVRVVKKMASTRKHLYDNDLELDILIDNLEKIQKFIVDYAATYYALITYHEIAAYYYYIDEQHQAVVGLITEQSEKLGLPSMQGRGLYKFVKKIDLDQRRLAALFAQNIISDELMIKVNQIKTKLIVLKRKIAMNPLYKSQLSKTRWFKACAVLILPFFVMLPLASYGTVFLGSSSAAYFFKVQGIGYLTLYGAGSLIVTIKELKESSQYDIPVHSTSLFSWFRPLFWPLTWVPRG